MRTQKQKQNEESGFADQGPFIEPHVICYEHNNHLSRPFCSCGWAMGSYVTEDFAEYKVQEHLKEH